MKKNICTFIILLIVACAVFYRGWVQFSIKQGYCGIMTSKTSGVYPEPIERGRFLWRWETLIPTNATLTLYPITPHETELTVEGSLPSADMFSSLLDEHPDFSYKVQMRITLSAEPESILTLVQEGSLSPEHTLEEYLDARAGAIGTIIASYLIAEQEDSLVTPTVLTESQLASVSRKTRSELSYVVLREVEILQAKIPDITLYGTVKNSFSAYENEVTEHLKLLAKNQAQAIIDADTNMKRLERFADLLERYPQLGDASTSGNLIEIMKEFKLME